MSDDWQSEIVLIFGTHLHYCFFWSESADLKSETPLAVDRLVERWTS